MRRIIFLEPEGAFTDEYYLNGISTSLPVDVQWELVHSIPGLEQAQISRYAYAIEYELSSASALCLRGRGRWPNLFPGPGQINGTSGYEEAAGQAIVAEQKSTGTARRWPEPVILPPRPGLHGDDR